jgi:hypothetical protein
MYANVMILDKRVMHDGMCCMLFKSLFRGCAALADIVVARTRTEHHKALVFPQHADGDIGTISVSVQ